MEHQGDTPGALATTTASGVATTQSAELADLSREESLPQTLDLAVAASPGEAREDPASEEYLLFWLGDAPYLVRLVDLREALPSVPRHVALPFSPRWLWGIFPLRTDLVALVDARPTLFHGPEAARDTNSTTMPDTTLADRFNRSEAPRALVVGEGEHLLALLADRIGDICQPDPSGQRPSETLALSDAMPQPQYVEGVYTLPGIERGVVALRIAPLVDDIFSALEERTAHE